MTPKTQRSRVSVSRIRPAGEPIAPSSISSGGTGSTVASRLRRILLLGCLGLVVLYLSGAAAGFFWMRYARHNDQITFMQVALLRWRSLRHEMAAQQFQQAKVQFDAKAYQSAYLLYASGVRNDPDNVAGRLAAAHFFEAVGALNLAIGVLEDGVARSPRNEELVEHTLELLTTRARDPRALSLVRQLSGGSTSAPTALLQRYEVLATLNTEGAAAAARVLEKYPDLHDNLRAAPIVARVWWETRDRLRAIELLTKYVQHEAGDLKARTQLTRWESAGGMPSDALELARRSCAEFPSDPAPRLLVIELLGQPKSGSETWRAAVESYLHDFSSRPESIGRLAELAGRMGWADLARACYEVGATRLGDVSMLALYYADALAANAKYPEAMQILAQIESQTVGSSPFFLVGLRQRQILVAAKQGDRDTVREAARRLGATLGNDQDSLQALRQHFAQIGISDAVAELATSGRVASVKSSSTR